MECFDEEINEQDFIFLWLLFFVVRSLLSYPSDCAFVNRQASSQTRSIQLCENAGIAHEGLVL